MDPCPLNDDETEGHRIWRCFKKVIILDEQMSQAKDPAFQSLLGHARSGSLTQNDVDLLNTKVVSSILPQNLDDVIFIVQRNSLCHSLTHCRLQHFASNHSEFLYIFPAEHSRTKSSSKLQLRLGDLLLHPDDGTKCPFPGLFVYTQGMPVMLLENLSTKMGQVNGSIGIAVGIGIDSTATFLQFDHRTIPTLHQTPHMRLLQTTASGSKIYRLSGPRRKRRLGAIPAPQSVTDVDGA